MAITGTFLADFSNFTTAVEQAEVTLKGFEGDANKVQSALSRMTDSFSGRKVIQDATLMAEAIRKVGVSTLTTGEAAGSLRQLEQAMDKMLRTGEQIPTTMMKTAAELRNVGRVSDIADASMTKISTSYRQFDGILQSLGINIGPYVKGLEDVTNLVKGGLPAMGTFGALAAAAGVALASWELGKKIGELTGWTNEIARGTAVLRGYGDVAQETAMAVADARDSAGHAEKMWRLQAKSVEDAAQATAAQSEEIRRSSMVAIANEGHFEKLKRQLEATTQAHKDAAIATFQASQAQEVFAQKADFTTEVIVEQTDAFAALAAQTAAARAEVDSFMTAPTLNDQVNPVNSFDLQPLSQTDIQNLNTLYDPFNQGGDFGVWTRLKALEAKEGTYAPTSFEEYSLMLREILELAQLRMWAQGKQRPPGFKDGVENFSGGLAYVHKDEMLVNMPKGTSVIPAGSSGWGGMNIVVNVNAGLGDRHSIGKAIKDVLVAEFKSFGYRGPVPFGA